MFVLHYRLNTEAAGYLVAAQSYEDGLWMDIEEQGELVSRAGGTEVREIRLPLPEEGGRFGRLIARPRQQ